MTTENQEPTLPSPDTHPDESLLAGFAEGSIDAQARTTITQHLLVCETCLATIAMLAQVDDQAKPQPAGDLQARALAFGAASIPSDGKRSSWAAAAALFLMLGIALIWSGLHPISDSNRKLGGLPEDHRALRGPSPRTTGPTILTPEAGQTLQPPPLTVTWTPMPDSKSYSVLILTADGDPLWRQRTTTTRLVVPETVPLKHGEAYFVSVRAHLLEARTLSSQHLEFRIGPRP